MTPHENAADPGGLLDLVDRAEVVISCGTGGVGKTTTAAALALLAARGGRRVVVVTIDPARRLADALGLDGVDNTASRLDGLGLAGNGELWITMLDTKMTFDGLIRRHAADERQAERILTNRYYRNLSGTREFMAMERLFELHGDDRFDLVVIDTPPSRNALDFLDAPDQLRRFLDGRVLRLAMAGSGARRALAAPFIAVMRAVARVVSPAVVDDTLAFIEAFSGMEDGFRRRAHAVDALLRDDTTAFCLVAGPTGDAVDESLYFVDRLRSSGFDIAAVVINRVQHRFTEVSATELDGLAEALDPADGAPLRVLRALTRLADSEDAELGPLIAACPDAMVRIVEQFDDDVHDLDGIARVADALIG